MSEAIIDDLLAKVVEYIGPQDRLAAEIAERKYLTNLIIDRSIFQKGMLYGKGLGYWSISPDSCLLIT